MKAKADGAQAGSRSGPRSFFGAKDPERVVRRDRHRLSGRGEWADLETQ